MKRGINWKVLIISLILVYGIAILGGILTSSKTNSSWYELIKPSITPPNYVFPIVWNILFLFIAISLYLFWISAKKNQKKKIGVLFGLNLILNLLWSFLFFTMQNPLFAFYDLILLVFSTILIILATYKINKISCFLLIPYLLWLSFAGILNYLIAFK